MGKILLILLPFLLGIGMVFCIGNFVGWEEIIKSFNVFSAVDLALILFLTLLIVCLSNWRWQMILWRLGEKVSFWGLLAPYLAGFSISFLAPTLIWGGEAFRGYSVKEKFSVAWPKAFASVILDRIIEWTSNLIVIFLGTILFFHKIGLPSNNLTIIFGGVFIFFLFLIGLFYFKAFRRESVVKFFLRV